MAALSEPPLQGHPLELCDLRHLRSSDLVALLAEETEAWQNILAWDFTKSVELVRKFVDLRALNGFALLHQKTAVGYAYYVLEENKGLVGDLYVQRSFQTAWNEQRLLTAVLAELRATAYVQRIESQLMMLSTPVIRPWRDEDYLNIYPREFLSVQLPVSQLLAPRRLPSYLLVETWSEQHQEDAAKLIAQTYQGHVDSLINDQYRSVAGARRFLFNIVQYPGCGIFFRFASLSAFDSEKGILCGICLTSMVGLHSGHVTQICVAPDYQGLGLGYELLRRSLELLEKYGCQKASLTVTSENRAAAGLYRSLGFQHVRSFAAYVWEGW